MFDWKVENWNHLKQIYLQNGNASTILKLYFVNSIKILTGSQSEKMSRQWGDIYSSNFYYAADCMQDEKIDLSFHFSEMCFKISDI